MNGDSRLLDLATTDFLARRAGLVVGEDRLEALRDHLQVVQDDVQAVEQLDIDGVEPASIFDPRWR
jgi:hypothetical protein